MASIFSLAVVFALFSPGSWLAKHAKDFNCEWVRKQLQTQTEEQLEAKARKWHVPEEYIQLAKQCPR